MRFPDKIDPIYYDPEVRAEHRLVNYTLRKLHRLRESPDLDADKKLDKHMKPDGYYPVLNEQAIFGEPGRLTLNAMHEVIDLPIRLYRGRFSIAKMTVKSDSTVLVTGGGTIPSQIGHLVTRFEKSAIGKAFRRIQSVHRASRDRRPVGMLFPFSRIPGSLILHNGQFITPSPTIITTKRDTLRLERYEHVLKAIVAGDLGLGPSASAESELATVTAAVRKQFGHGTAARLVCFLAEHQIGQPAVDQQNHMECLSENIWVVMTFPELGRAIDASPRAVQAAVAELKRKGILESHRGGFEGAGSGNGYRINFEMLTATDTLNQEGL